MNDEKDPEPLLEQLRDEVAVPAGDDSRLTRVLTASREYVASAVGTATVSEAVRDDCILGCAADLYNSRDARLGVMDITDGQTEPFRVPTDPLRSVWPKLRAAGINTGGMVIS
jgi:hypothetical protein